MSLQLFHMIWILAKMSEGLINKKDKDSQLKFTQRAYHNSFSNFSQQNIDNRLIQKKMKIFTTLFFEIMYQCEFTTWFSHMEC